MNRDRIAFVHGVDRDGAKPPEGLPFRFAVLTWLGHEDETDEPWALLRPVFPRIAALVGADCIIAEYWERHRTGNFLFRRSEESLVVAVAWEGLMHCSDEQLHEQTFPSRFRFLSGSRVVLRAESEMWNMVGGPSPYHDSVTVSFFSTEPMHEQLRRLFAEEAAKLGVAVEDTIESSD